LQHVLVQAQLEHQFLQLRIVLPVARSSLFPGKIWYAVWPSKNSLPRAAGRRICEVLPGCKMISALLNTVQTTLLGARGFLLTSLLPVVLFAIGCFVLDTKLVPQHALWAAQLVQEKPGFAASCVLLLILVAAYMFSSLNTVLRQVLEGKYLPRPLREKYVRHQLKIAENARAELEKNQRLYHKISHANWVDTLRKAREEGSKKEESSTAVVPIVAKLKKKVKEFTTAKNSLQPLDYDDLEEAVSGLTSALKGANANKPGDANSCALSEVHVELVQNIQYEIGRLQRRRTEALWDAAAYPDDVAPTRMGNIAGTVRYYAESRYGILLDVFWTRLQRLMQADEKSFNALQDAKIQLDFFVSMAWLSALFSFVWSIVLMAASANIFLFIAVCAGGVATSIVCYQLGCQSYMTFAEVVRGAIDLTRFQLISAYHLPLPVGSDEEEQLWENLASRIAYDSPISSVIYEHKTP